MRDWPQVINIKSQKISNPCCKQLLKYSRMFIGVDSTVHPSQDQVKMTKKLAADSNTSPKTYWTILNRLLYNKRIRTMPPLLVDGKLVSDFCNKTIIFNNFFASICTPIDNASCLPSCSYRTGSRIKSFHVTKNDILAIVKQILIMLMVAIIYLLKG